MKAMVFAAGEGSRLQPLTLTRPKALIEVGGQPMIARVLRALRSAGVTDVVVNTHYLAEQISDYLSANDFGMRVFVTREHARRLETGGGLLAARDLLDDGEPILLHNADICTDLDLSRLTLRGDATLLVSERESSRRLMFDADMRLRGWINESSGEIKGSLTDLRRAFSGIHIVSPSIFPALQKYSETIGSDVFSLTPFYLQMADELEIYGSELSGYRWFDIGNLEKLAAAEAAFTP